MIFVKFADGPEQIMRIQASSSRLTKSDVPSVSLSLLRVPVEAERANDSGMMVPRVASSFNFDCSAGREFKL